MVYSESSGTNIYLEFMVASVSSLSRQLELKRNIKQHLWKDSQAHLAGDPTLLEPASSIETVLHPSIKNHNVEKKKSPGQAKPQYNLIQLNLGEKRTDIQTKKAKTSPQDEIRLYHFIESPSYPLTSILMRGRYYQPIREIGTGSFGKALLVKDLRCEPQEKQYVMKIIDTARLGPKERADAVNEVQLLASLRHPYIISYKESFVEKCFLCIVMDYADGGDLFKTITQQRVRGERFSESQILRWFTQATLALKYLHEKHILHRDLKSQNLFLMSKGRLRLGDFGIAKALDCTSAFTKTQIGTPYYLSPEICKNQPYSWASDIWALGCILYELATLRVPFSAPNITALLNKITSQSPPQIPDIYSLGLRQLCRDCLQREWKRRPSAAALLQRDITQNEIRAMLLEEHIKRRRQGHQNKSSLVSSSITECHNRISNGVASHQNSQEKNPTTKGESRYDKKKYQQFSIIGDVELPVPPRLTYNSQAEYGHAFWSQSTEAGDSPQHPGAIEESIRVPQQHEIVFPRITKPSEVIPSSQKKETTCNMVSNHIKDQKQLSQSNTPRKSKLGYLLMKHKSGTEGNLRNGLAIPPQKKVLDIITKATQNKIRSAPNHSESQTYLSAPYKVSVASPFTISPNSINKSLFALNLKEHTGRLHWEAVQSRPSIHLKTRSLRPA